MISSVKDHYELLLAEHYDWMFGLPFEAKVAEQKRLLEDLGVGSTAEGAAVDLGCGSGFQSVALSELGYRVLAVDSSQKLIRALVAARASPEITAQAADIRELYSLAGPNSADVVVCMGDTLTHLSTRQEVVDLFRSVVRALKPTGLFVLSYRDLAASELTGVDRFIPVRSDASKIMTCFLEYENETTVIVSDLIHARDDAGRWHLHKSSYRKLRLPLDWVRGELRAAGFTITACRMDRMVAIAATMNPDGHLAAH